jgi:hypothetical protein
VSELGLGCQANTSGLVGKGLIAGVTHKLQLRQEIANSYSHTIRSEEGVTGKRQQV